MKITDVPPRNPIPVKAMDPAKLPPNVRCGVDSFVESENAFLRFWSRQDPGLVLGDRVRAFIWTNFSVEPTGRVEIGNDTVLVGGLFMCAESITLGERVLVSYNVTIADCDFHPIDPELRKLDAVAVSPTGDPSQRPSMATAPVVIEDDVRIGIGAIILKGVTIHAGASIAAGTVVTKDVPPGVKVVGNPGVVVEGSLE